MKIPETLPAQLKLALLVGFGVKDEINAFEARQLRLETIPATTLELREIAAQIVWETLLACLPANEEPVDLRKVAVELLYFIREQGGRTTRSKILLDRELIDQFIKEGVLAETINGIVWGRNAQRAINEVENEENKS